MKEKELITYIPDTITIPKDLFYDSIIAIESGIENTRMLLMDHDSNLGRTTKKNSSWAALLENDIHNMNEIISRLRARPWAK